MIFGLTPVQSVQAILNQIAKIEINALLQMGIKVLDAKPDGRYLIQMGQHTFETKSDQPLIPGRTYWVSMSQTKEGVIHLSRLHPKPQLLQKGHFFELPFLERLAKSPDPAGGYKELVMQQMAHAASKEQFQNLTALLMSMHHGVLSIPLERQGRKSLLQMRKKGSNEKLNQKSVEFYAAMTNLGPVKGLVMQQNQINKVTLKVHYRKSVDFLKRHTEELKGFEWVEIVHHPQTIAPFWDGDSRSLLDIRG